MEKFDLVIAGGGPAGCTLALMLSEANLNVGILEKEVFPRDKICGDALSGQVVNILKRLPKGTYERFTQEVPNVASGGIRFISPAMKSADIPFNEGTGYICRRRDFDHFLWREIGRAGKVSRFEGTRISAVQEDGEGITLQTGNGMFYTRMLAAADGVHSLIRRTLFPGNAVQIPRCIGIRGYFEGVADLHPQHFIELHFLKETLPGYFWIFHGPENMANVGLGLLLSQIKKGKISLTILFEKIIRENPVLKSRFSGARRISPLEAHPLPLGTRFQPISRNRCILLGDAAALVDPFTGEGIGNSMASAETAARMLISKPVADDYSSDFLSAYDLAIRKRMGTELHISTLMQRCVNYPFLINQVIKKASRNDAFRQLLSSMYTNEKARSELTRLPFYIKLLTGIKD